MGVIRKRQGICWSCTESGGGKRGDLETAVSSQFALVRGCITIPNSNSVADIQDCWECERCGELVPFNTMREYQQTGNIVARKERKRGR